MFMPSMVSFRALQPSSPRQLPESERDDIIQCSQGEAGKCVKNKSNSLQVGTIKVQFLKLVFVLYSLCHSQSSVLCDLAKRQIELLLSRKTEIKTPQLNEVQKPCVCSHVYSGYIACTGFSTPTVVLC